MLPENYLSTAVTLQTAIRMSVASLRSGTTPFLQGPYGIGKSSAAPLILKGVVQGLLAEGAITGKQAEEATTVILTPTSMGECDIRGLPTFIEENGVKRTSWAMPDFFPANPEAITLLFVDELPDCKPSMQSVLYQLLLDRRIGEHILPSHTYVMAAGNGTEFSLASQPMAQPCADRFTPFLQVKQDKDEWSAWAAQEGLHSGVIGYVNWKPEALHGHDFSHRTGGCTPRSLAHVARNLEYTSPEDIQELCISTVGPTYGTELAAYLALVGQQLPDPEECLASPLDAPLPEGKSAHQITWALCSAIAPLIEEANFENAILYSKRLDGIKSLDVGPNDTGPFGFQIVRQAQARGIGKGESWTRDWLLRNQESISA